MQPIEGFENKHWDFTWPQGGASRANKMGALDNLRSWEHVLNSTV